MSAKHVLFDTVNLVKGDQRYLSFPLTAPLCLVECESLMKTLLFIFFAGASAQNGDGKIEQHRNKRVRAKARQ